jgi:tRNA pseudouridine55 synthase
VKVGGKRLYRLARQGETVEREPRPIFIRSFELIRYEPPVAEVNLVCSKGTYVRTVAADIGEELGCGAYLDRLTRVRIGPYHVKDACSMEALESLAGEGRAAEACLSLEKAVEAIPRAVLRVSPGRYGGVSLPKSMVALEPLETPPSPGEFLRIHDRSGRPVGVVEVAEEMGKLRKVLLLEQR